MKTVCYIAPALEPQFAESGLNSFDALMEGSGKVQRTVLRDGSVFYLKREEGEPVWKKCVPMFLRGLRPHSGPLREVRLLQLLRANGFLAMEPVAWGEQRLLGIPLRGFLVVREVKGEELADLFDRSNGYERQQLMKAFGRLTGRLHAKGFFQPVRLKDLIHTDAGLVLIDRETSKPWRSLFFPQQCRDSLTRAIRRMIRDGHHIGAGSACAFLHGYRRGVAERWKISPCELAAQICFALRSEMES